MTVTISPKGKSTHQPSNSNHGQSIHPSTRPLSMPPPPARHTLSTGSYHVPMEIANFAIWHKPLITASFWHPINVPFPSPKSSCVFYFLPPPTPNSYTTSSSSSTTSYLPPTPTCSATSTLYLPPTSSVFSSSTLLLTSLLLLVCLLLR